MSRSEVSHETPEAADESVFASAYAWRLPGEVITLENFDVPRLHRRGEYDARALDLLMSPRMAGSVIRRSPDEVRDAIRSGEFSDDDKRFLHGLLKQFDRYLVRCFLLHAGISPYELARAMIASKVRQQRLTIWMNRHSPNFKGEDIFRRTWDVDFRI